MKGAIRVKWRSRSGPRWKCDKITLKCEEGKQDVKVNGWKQRKMWLITGERCNIINHGVLISAPALKSMLGWWILHCFVRDICVLSDMLLFL